jgi:hypothetical protein
VQWLSHRKQIGGLIFASAFIACAHWNGNLSAPIAHPTPTTPLSRSLADLHPPPIPHDLQNPWTPDLEAEFQSRSQAVIRHFANPRAYGNGYGENEKRSYPMAMLDWLAGNRKRAIAFLQAEDPQAQDHAHTAGIDYYFSFTLKGQVRKFFLWRSQLDPTYYRRMLDGAKAWTERDPLTRPHPLYGTGDGSGRDWSIRRRGYWVDGRNTDNLRAMRETSVYLMAEATGNEATRKLYRQKLHRYVNALYQIGMGEWDSQVYHGHTFAPYLNLYDFARDRQVKQLAKAALDWLSVSAAVKYYRGGWGGPVKRDYGGGSVVFGSGAAKTFWLYYGDSPLTPSKPELDSLASITSSYRPPIAAVALARKLFPKPLELLSTKPLYENWKPGNDRAPGYWETQFFGQTYQMGSLAGPFPDGDVAPFKLMAFNSRRGADYFTANSGGEWVRPGKNPGDEIGQFRNLLVWLRPSDVPFNFQLPRSAIRETTQGITFIQLEKTYLALHPINLHSLIPRKIDNSKLAKAYPDEFTLHALPSSESNYSGFALEVGESPTYRDFSDFKQATLQRSHVDLSRVDGGKVTFNGNRGDRLTLQYNLANLLPRLAKNGTPFHWQEHYALYANSNGTKSPLNLGWKQGVLRLEAGGHTFQSQVLPLSTFTSLPRNPPSHQEALTATTR